MPVSRGPLKAVEFALERGCEVAQIFSSNPRSWAPSKMSPAEDAELLEALAAKDIGPLLLHTPYLINIATDDDALFARSVANLAAAAERACRLRGAVIVHAGKATGRSREEALDRAAAAVLTALELHPEARILVELTAGGRGAVAARLPEGAELLEAIGDERVGVCLDTCHAHASGYDLTSPSGARAWVDEACDRIGASRIGAIHANDSRDPRGSHRDRHWHLGQGEIGEAGFTTILGDARLAATVVVCETPGGPVEDRDNIARARRYAGHP